MRAKKRLPPLSESAVRRVLRGEAYQRGKLERRGRPKKATASVIKKFEKSRQKLLKKAKSTRRVTYAGIVKAARLTKTISVRRLQPALKKAEGIAWRPGVSRPDRSKDEITERKVKAANWQRYPESHWVEEIHGYIDNKTFYVPTTHAKRDLLQRQKVTGHLRKKSEGNNPACLLPKKQKGGIGCPSVCITACVAPSTGRVILWHPSEKWNGEAAKTMYEKHLLPALKRTHGTLDFYRIVEDGDPTGYQSSKGRAAKRAAKIRSWQLPPRTPEWMPLDYSLWATIESTALAAAGPKESKASYTRKLTKAAKSLSVSYVKKTCASMKKRIKMTLDAGGQHINFE